MKKILAAVLAVFAVAVALPAAAEANNAGIACNAIRFGYNGGPSSQLHAGQYYMNAYFGAFQYGWVNSGVTPVGYLGNESGIYVDGSGYCVGSWQAYSLNGSKPVLRCRYFSKTTPGGSVLFVRPRNPGDPGPATGFPCAN